jgi:hypothetical protein
VPLKEPTTSLLLLRRVDHDFTFVFNAKRPAAPISADYITHLDGQSIV